MNLKKVTTICPIFFGKNKTGYVFGALLLVMTGAIKAQNFIPDPSFEALASADCALGTTTEVWSNSLFWYDAHPTSEWFIDGCPPPAFHPFWGTEEGQGSAGLSMDLRARGFHYSEAIGTPLVAPLEDGLLYYFEMDVRNRGIIVPTIYSYSGDCMITPQKDLRVYSSSESIDFTIDESNGDFSVNADLLLRFNDDFLAGSSPTLWETLGRCFVGSSNMQHIAIAPRLGTFAVAPPCTLQDSTGVFNIAYYNIDHVNLYALPKQIDTTIVYCTSQTIKEVDLAGVFDKRALKNVAYTWEDGLQGSRRTLEEEGEYRAEILLDCGTIPVTVAVDFNICEAQVYVPNAFSPNDDGINDQFGPFIASDFSIVDYEFRVFDRWGSLVFESNQMDQPWNGHAFGRPMANGVYIWTLSYAVVSPTTKQSFQEQGDVLIIR
jgi:gliding motility-associated-like protein